MSTSHLVVLASTAALALLTGDPSHRSHGSFRVNEDQEFTDEFMLDRCTFTTTGRNPYYILEPGWELRYEGESDGEFKELLIRVTDETRVVDGVRTRVVMEVEHTDGELVEVSFNYFAICKENRGLIYFGEEVDIYEDGEVVSHDGSWRAGEDGARPGLLVPGLPLVGSRYFQEVAPDVALDRGENISLKVTVDTPAGTFENCLFVEESTPLEPGHFSYKHYALDVGLIQDNDIQLVGYGFQDEDDDDDDDDDDEEDD